MVVNRYSSENFGIWKTEATGQNGTAGGHVPSYASCGVRNVGTKEKVVEIANYTRVTDAFQPVK